MRKSAKHKHPAVVVFILILLMTGTCLAEDDLVAHWPMDEGTGTAISDISGNANNGTVYGATWVQGYSDDGLQFDGVNDYVYCGNGASLNGLTALTLDLWVKPLALPSANARIISKGDYSTGVPSGYQYTLYYDTGGNVHFLISNGSISANIMAPLPLGNFQHIVATWDGEVAKLFVDDMQYAATYLQGPLNTQSAGRGLYLGALAGTDVFFKGLIDEVKIYSILKRPAFYDVACLHNSSFNQSTNSTIPDWWGGEELSSYIENWQGCFTVDESVPAPLVGTKSLKIHNPLYNFNFKTYYGQYSVPIPVLNGRQYTLSLYIKGEQTSFPVVMELTGITGTRVENTVTTAWQRYSSTFTVSIPSGYKPSLLISLPNQGTVWISAVQLEEGAVATDYHQPKADLLYPYFPGEQVNLSGTFTPFVNPSLIVLAEHSFYISDDTARMAIDWEFIGQSTIDFLISLRDLQDNELQAQQLSGLSSKGRMFYPLSIGSLASGQYKVVVTAGNSGVPLSSVEAKLLKLPPLP
ncbi:MAG: LamG-like jellyroll fold domain-containing protein [bacterium]